MKLFVYGTLKKGFPLNELLKSYKYLGKDTIKGFEIYSNGFFPYIVHGDGEVIGEVYEIDEKGLYPIDCVERGYRREQAKAEKFGDVQAYVYYGDVDNLVKVDKEFK